MVEGPRSYELHAGVLEGAGSMINPVTIGSFAGSVATLAPGGEGAIGLLTLGTVTLRSGAVVDVDLGGTAAGASDLVAVGGNLVLAGTLRVRLAQGFTPAVGDRFAVVTCSGTCSGTFASLDLAPGLSATVAVSSSQVELVVTGFVADESSPGAPTALALGVAPNPSVGSARVTVDLPEAAVVRVAVLDLLGREVAVLLDGEQSAGTHALPLDAARLAPGVYVVRLVTSSGALVRRLTIAR
jgi:hypothetical protein